LPEEDCLSVYLPRIGGVAMLLSAGGKKGGGGVLLLCGSEGAILSPSTRQTFWPTGGACVLQVGGMYHCEGKQTGGATYADVQFATRPCAGVEAVLGRG